MGGGGWRGAHVWLERASTARSTPSRETWAWRRQNVGARYVLVGGTLADTEGAVPAAIHGLHEKVMHEARSVRRGWGNSRLGTRGGKNDGRGWKRRSNNGPSSRDEVMQNPKAGIRGPKQIGTSNFMVAARTTRSVLECGGLRRFPSAAYAYPLAQGATGLAPSKTWQLSLAQYAVDWWTTDSGGGTSTGGVNSVTGTMGQPDVSSMSGGNFTLQGGFWGIIATAQTPGAPLLSIFRTTTNTVAVSWPSPATGWTLQQNTTTSVR